MAFCTQCGAQLEEGAKFCTVCGAKQPEMAAPVYTPPAAETPAAPETGYTYTPPASTPGVGQNGYTYDPTVYGGGNGGNGGSGGKKKSGAIIFIILAALVVIGAIIYLVAGKAGGGKGADPDNPVLGLYTAQKAETAGISISIKTMWEKGFSIELKSKGKAEINVDGEKFNAKWTLDGEDFSIEGTGKNKNFSCNGKLDDGVLTLENVLDTGMMLYFTKDGAALPSAETPKPQASSAPAPNSDPAPAPAPADDAVAGLYKADKAEAYGIEVAIETMWEKGFSIELKDDGKCTLNVNGTAGSGTWSLNGDTISVNVPGFNMDGTLRDGVLVFEDLYGMGVTLYFSKDGAAAPSPAPVPSAAPAVNDASEWWDGDWYGWWAINDCGGLYKENNYSDSYWDACASIKYRGDGSGKVEIWDEDNDWVAKGEVVFSAGETDLGSMSNSNVEFWDYQIPEGEWVVDPGSATNRNYPDSIIISGHYEDPENEGSWFDYDIFLRPWGAKWDDLDAGLLPYYYDNWYLPLIEAGEAMPDLFEGLD